MKSLRRFAYIAAILSICLWAVEECPAAEWTFASATSGMYTVQEVEQDGTTVNEQLVTVAEGIEFSTLGSPVGFTAGVIALQDEGESLPRLAPFGSLNLGGETLRWSVGGLYDRHQSDPWRLLTGGTVRF